ncbi:TetR/AcrR family transcriptional regulator [Pusillimonas sp.]|uniref:TetR/AcrR family transcriptional regulator n=1 Tax=Pusillimonas sp. TaxID=3040095 RepID=UPI0037CBDB7F
MSDQSHRPDEASSVEAPRARRQPRDQRRAQILRESIAFFSEHGFSGSTHDLARQIGVTQPLLFRYFDSKEDLFEAIFKAVFTDKWQDEWPSLICDRTIPLRERLARFYRSYLAVIFNRDWMRLYIYAGLADVPINRRFFELIETKILIPLCAELRAEFHMVPPEIKPITNDELDYVWMFHGGIFYHGIRRCAFGTSSDHEINPGMLDVSIDTFIAAAPHALARLLRLPGKHPPTT